jgi:predicted metal-binding protein
MKPKLNALKKSVKVKKDSLVAELDKLQERTCGNCGHREVCEIYAHIKVIPTQAIIIARCSMWEVGKCQVQEKSML